MIIGLSKRFSMTRKVSTRRKELTLSIGILLLISCLYTLFSFWTPEAYDDWVFMAEWRDVNGGKPLTLSALYDFWKDIRLYDNGRIANVLSPLSTVYSPWKEIFPILTGIFVAGIVVFTAFFSFGKKCLSPFLISVVWVPVLLLLPWRNSLFVADYSLNYIWATIVTMSFMVSVVWCERHGWNIYNFVLCLILAFIAGGWHEGFAVPTLAGFVLYTLKRLRFSSQWYIVGIFYGAVTLSFYFCPGLLARTQEQMGGFAFGMSYLKMAFDFLAVMALVMLVGLTAVIPSLRKYLREAWCNIWFVTGSGIVAVGTVLSLLFTHQPRSSFWPDLFAIIMIFILTRPLWMRLKMSSFGSFLTALALCICAIPMYYALIWQYELYRESKSILTDLEKSESGTVFHNIIKGSDIPMAALKMTNHPAWVTDFNHTSLKNYTGKPYVAVVPTVLGNPSSYASESYLEGNADAMLIGNAVVLPYDAGKIRSENVEIELKDGRGLRVIALILPYMTPMGVPYTYVSIYNNSGFPSGIQGTDLKGIWL